MRYGSQTIIQSVGNLTQHEEEKYHDWATTFRIIRFTESVAVNDAKDVLTEFLKLQDMQKEGKACDIGIYAYTDKQGKIKRIEKVWTVKDLR